ncbi:hypothetical protein K1T71_006580 [Dendrolimus kikuchii]|uniref:Uncharacterized protein n=1 Tax=Dendrolimus kikuchii TaxID=765133 RepID=A0ACC1D1J5_9NEOP|nr:hypothetical protein K1T71_006580 [Dendrolimus kikuchii]
MVTPDKVSVNRQIDSGNMKDLPQEEFDYNNNSVKNSVEAIRDIGTDLTYKHIYVWPNVIIAIILHILALWGLGIIFSGGIKMATFIWSTVTLYYDHSCIAMSGEGITMGAHRYYAHKSFKATPLLRAILIILHTVAGQNSMFVWVRDHRVHHRFSDTDADPHNIKRGFFFSHMGWLMKRKHPLVLKLGKTIDMSDLQSDWMVMFQKKYYLPLYLIVAIFIPVWVPVHFFGEELWKATLCSFFARYLLQLHETWLVNSAAHLYGLRPYDKNLQSVESWFVSFVTLGEGWHNYHHAFPWDYKAAELSKLYNFTAYLIKYCEYLGLAWDLKTASPDVVAKRITRTGDGTHYALGNDEARAAVTAVGPLHPLNPSYTSTLKSPDVKLKAEGIPLFHEKDVNSIFVWVRDHRLHHRFSDTDADPHNIKRGFFFSHMGWLMKRKHPLVLKLGKTIDMSDLQSDWMVMFQKKYYLPLYVIVAIFIPVWVPVHFFGEELWKATLCSFFARYLLQLHETWLVNSAAHLYGLRPYDKNLQPVESWFVSFVTLGEGWHNYHHAFPWDYKAAELSKLYNFTADLSSTVAKRITRTGDGTHYALGNDEARAAVTAVGPLHPLNPSYTSTLKSPDVKLKAEGIPLFHEKDVVCPINVDE